MRPGVIQAERQNRGAPIPLPVSLIIDSPWIPGIWGISTLTMVSLHPEPWLQANLPVAEEFPEIIVPLVGGIWHGD